MPDARQAAAAEPLSPGQIVLDRYRAVERIALGGHSVVYRGDDERLARPVCIKVFHKIGASDGLWRTSYEHFVQEAFALSQLTHPNTLRIYDFGHLPPRDGDPPDRGLPFQVSEYMDGGTLSRRVRIEGPLSVDDATAITVALCGALAEAHDRGIIHRDIKPKNILFAGTAGGRAVKLADFGIAKATSTEDIDVRRYRASDTRVIAGEHVTMLSPRWAAPEQLAGDPVGPATDIYALGAVTVFMLTGIVPFAAEGAVEAQRRRERAADVIRALFDGVAAPPAVVDALVDACRYDPADRPRDALAFADALARAARRTRAPSHLTPVPPPADGAARPAAPPRPLRVEDAGAVVAGRRCVFVPTDGGAADVAAAGGAVRARVSIVPGADGYCAGVKGLSCFVARGGARPSVAVQLFESAPVEFVQPNGEVVARADIDLGRPAAGHRVFDVGGVPVALSVDQCPQAVVLDFGPDAECVFVYAPPARAMGSARATGRRRRSS
ncbi:MAG: serine/threonine protein kinase [Deltaproteobacteria bacterium]|nr:MAG: serine/threonine protein kinase [Deltaproteobacteria bacterium]